MFTDPPYYVVAGGKSYSFFSDALLALKRYNALGVANLHKRW